MTCDPSTSRRAVERDERHRHVSGVFGQYPGRVGDGDPTAERTGHVDVVDAVAEIGDKLHLLARLGDHRSVDVVGDGRHENVRLAHRLDDLGLGQRLVFEIEASVEQLAHTGLDKFGQPPRHHHQGFLLGHERRPLRPCGAIAATAPISAICVHAFKRFTPR